MVCAFEYLQCCLSWARCTRNTNNDYNIWCLLHLQNLRIPQIAFGFLCTLGYRSSSEVDSGSNPCASESVFFRESWREWQSPRGESWVKWRFCFRESMSFCFAESSDCLRCCIDQEKIQTYGECANNSPLQLNFIVTCRQCGSVLCAVGWNETSIVCSEKRTWLFKKPTDEDCKSVVVEFRVSSDVAKWMARDRHQI